jgi:hypothetical protein
MFAINLPEGQFAISLLQLPMGYTVKSMTQGTIDLLKGSTFRIASATTPVGARMVLTAKPPEGNSWKKISGRVDGFVPGTSSIIVIAPATASLGGPAGTVVEERVGETRVRPDGTFEIANVPKGSYTLQYRPDPTGGRVLWGRMVPLTVVDLDMNGVNVPAAP